MKTLFIYNPVSGRNRKRERLLSVLQQCVQHREWDAQLMTTREPGHAQELANNALAGGFQRIVAVGGDGTVNEVARALVGGRGVLGILPCGSGNGLAMHLGIPLHPERAVATLYQGRGRMVVIDSATAGGHPFFNVMGIGFDAEISNRFNTLVQRGFYAYLKTGLQLFFQHQAETVAIHSEQDRYTLTCFMLTIANSDQFGNNARIAPGAKVDDGLLDLVSVARPGVLAAADLALRLFRGKIGGSRLVRCDKGRSFVLIRERPGWIHTDGEVHWMEERVEVSIRPDSLKVWVPDAASTTGLF